MTHYTVRDHYDRVTVYSTSVEGSIFHGSLHEWAEWKIERDQPTGGGITVVVDGEEHESEPRSGPYADAEPEEVIADYESNGWFETDTSRIPRYCL